jgi:hypothetical protein
MSVVATEARRPAPTCHKRARHERVVIRCFDQKAKCGHVLEGAATSILAQLSAFKDAVAV